MPRTMTWGGWTGPVATDDELLDFANAIRQAGGAGVIEALLPSTPCDPSSCLIANALNFGCEVNHHPNEEAFADGTMRWVMYLPSNLTDEQKKALGKVKGVRLVYLDGMPCLTLPKHIGNAADAFDYGAAFGSYVEDHDDA